MTADDFLDRLVGVRSHGSYWTARCPVTAAHSHGDKSPSLSVRVQENGWIQPTCHVGCTREAILEALALQNIDLLTLQVNFGEPEVVWTYQDPQANSVYQVVRFPGKRFRPRRYAPEHDDADKDGWVWSLEDVPRYPYRLPEVIQGVRDQRTIYIVEGERDVESLRAVGQVATCNPGGAGKWREEYSQYLAGAKVIIVADRDAPGRKHAERVKTSLQGVAQGIWVMQARSGKDVSDHLAAGFRVTDLELRKEHHKRGIVTAKELADAAREHLLMGEHDIPGYVLATEIPLIFRQGRTYAIGAYTGHGKTSYALAGFRRLATLGHRVGYFSLEMPQRDLTNKLLAHKGVPLRFTEEPWLLRANPELRRLYEQGVAEIEGWSADIIFESRMTAKRITEITEDREYEVIFVDHLHKFAWGDRRSFEQEIVALNAIALELNVAVIILCQFRKFEMKDGMAIYPKPTLQSFRETSVIQEESSIALAIWRSPSQDGIGFDGQTMAFVLKNRHTTSRDDKVGTGYYLHFDPAREMFVPQNAETPVVTGANGAAG